MIIFSRKQWLEKGREGEENEQIERSQVNISKAI